MRSSDKTYYSIKRLHLVFAVSAAVLVGTTVWMIAVDHNRPWKAYQRTFRDRVEPWWAGPQAAEQPSALAKWLARLPFVEAHARWLAVQQIWLPELTIDYNFRRVARFDRCTTCHLGIERGGGSVPGFGRAERLTVELATPPGPPGGGPTTESLYGFSLAPRGILDANVPTVSAVGDATAAARAGLYPGDGILRIGGQPVADRDAAAGRLSSGLVWGEPLSLEIERGLPQPYSGHPRIDLFVGGDSPHPAAEFGCTICHAGQGSATQFALAAHSPNAPQQAARWRARHDWSRSAHWDDPMLPARFLESSCLKCHHDVVDLEASERFLTPPAPKLLAGYDLVREHGCFGCHEISGVDAAGRRIGPEIGPEMRLEPAGTQRGEPLKPGTMRKVGPSLRHAAERLSADGLANWIADPSRLRSSTRMPRLFGLHEHLEGEEAAVARRFEAVEVRGIAGYLLAASQPVDPPPSASGVTEPPSAVRGRELLVRRGCAACHRHQDVPEATSTVGADLSGLASIFSTAAEKWLAGWIRDPAHYWPRTRMPNPLLAPEPVDGETPDGRPRMSDPAADLAAYLLESPGARLAAPPPLVTADLDALARSHLARQFTDKEADSLLAGGVAAAHGGDLGDAVELAVPTGVEAKLRYVGRRTIRKRGCAGCHDIPGFEDAQSIGPALADWGRKRESLLGFEQVERFLEKHPPRRPSDGSAADRGFYLAAISGRRREGFAWQKLRAPRSFDYKVAEQKAFNEQLTMGQFSFSADQREAIVTFLLGLVADPPAPRYVHAPDRRGSALIEGCKVLDRYGCAECHALRMEHWSFSYDPSSWYGPTAIAAYDFVQPKFTEDEIARSLRRDRRGWGHAEVVGEGRVDRSGALIVDEDDEGNPLYIFGLWEPALINGEVWPVSGAQVPISEPWITARHAGWGGAFARLLYPRVAEEAGAAWMEAWGRVPPPLVGEGRRAQPAWLYNYLLSPATIRPSLTMRMPRFQFSPDEAAALVDYFAAAGGVDFPYAAGPENLPRDGVDAARISSWEQAMRIVVDRTTFCAKCHRIGDYSPGGETQTILAPDLAQVGRRIRPEYLRRWLADPRSILPYTGMPVNFPPEGAALGQDLMPAASRDQLEAVADLLLHYDAYLQSRAPIRTMMEKASP